MKFYINNLTANRAVSRIITLGVVSVLNLLFVTIVLWLAAYLFSFGLKGKYFLYLIIAAAFSTLPIANFLFNRVHNFIKPAVYKDLYFKIMDSILGITTLDEIIHHTFYEVIKFMGAGFGSIIYYSNESDVVDIRYNGDETHKFSFHERKNSDDILIKRIKGPDIIIKSSLDKNLPDYTEIINAIEQLNADLIVPIFYNKQIFGIITIGHKKGFSEREFKLLKMVAYKLAQMSVNSYYFSEIRKGKEVEKEYELVNRIQKQFLPEPDLEYGRISIKAYHAAVSSLTREFYDIFVNDISPDDIRVSAYRVNGDVKEISILLPGIQAMLQSYTRLGFPPRKTMSKLKNIVKDRNLLSGELMIFHSLIRQSGEFICCCSNYPAPFCYRNSLKKLIQIAGKFSSSQYIKTRIEPGDIILAGCKHYSDIIKANPESFTEMIRKNHSLPPETLRDMLVQMLDITYGKSSRAEAEDKLLILIAVTEGN
jgi:hypothetical protein